MRYKINFDKVINQLIPYYLGGRRLILFLQSCMKPLQRVNNAFVAYAKETRIEASMTSQIFKLEWFLNRKFKKYFEDPSALIVIKNGEKLGQAMYNESASDINNADQFKLWKQTGETKSHTDIPLYHSNEKTVSSSHSFLVCVPKLWEQKDSAGKPTGQLIDGISVNQFKKMLAYWVDKYKLAGKTYQIIINTL